MIHRKSDLTIIFGKFVKWTVVGIPMKFGTTYRRKLEIKSHLIARSQDNIKYGAGRDWYGTENF